MVYLPGRESSEREGVSISHSEGNAIEVGFEGEFTQEWMDSGALEEMDELFEAL